MTLTREDRVILPVVLLGEREGGPGGVVEGSLSRRKDEDRQNPQDLSIAGILVNEGILLFLIILSSRYCSGQKTRQGLITVTAIWGRVRLNRSANSDLVDFFQKCRHFPGDALQVHHNPRNFSSFQ